MEDNNVFIDDPYQRSDVNSEKLGDSNLWSSFFSPKCTIKTEYIDVENGVSLLLISSIPNKTENLKSLFFIPGWFSNIAGWKEIILHLSNYTNIFYLDTREKTTSRHLIDKINYSVERMADDFKIVGDSLSENIEDMIVIASSMGGTMMFNYLVRYEKYPYRTILMGPNPSIKVPPVIGTIILHLPLFMFNLTIKYITWHIIKFRLDTKKDPTQILKYLQVIRLAIPRRMKGSAKSVTKYNGWNDIEKIRSKIILVLTKVDKLHGMERTKKIGLKLENPGYLEFESNTEAHSIEFANKLLMLAKDNETVLTYNI